MHNDYLTITITITSPPRACGAPPSPPSLAFRRSSFCSHRFVIFRTRQATVVMACTCAHRSPTAPVSSPKLAEMGGAGTQLLSAKRTLAPAERYQARHRGGSSTLLRRHVSDNHKRAAARWLATGPGTLRRAAVVLKLAGGLSMAAVKKASRTSGRPPGGSGGGPLGAPGGGGGGAGAAAVASGFDVKITSLPSDIMSDGSAGGACAADVTTGCDGDIICCCCC